MPDRARRQAWQIARRARARKARMTEQDIARLIDSMCAPIAGPTTAAYIPVLHRTHGYGG